MRLSNRQGFYALWKFLTAYKGKYVMLVHRTTWGIETDLCHVTERSLKWVTLESVHGRQYDLNTVKESIRAFKDYPDRKFLSSTYHEIYLDLWRVESICLILRKANIPFIKELNEEYELEGYVRRESSEKIIRDLSYNNPHLETPISGAILYIEHCIDVAKGN